MAEPTLQIPPSHPSVASDLASESFIVQSDSMTVPVDEEPTAPRPESPTTEKQSLLDALDRAHSALDKTRAENDDLKEQLSAAQVKNQDQADQIAMLRGKVEEARRGVMRLQTENRRASQLVAGANSQELRSAKRASFVLPPTPGSPGGLGSGKHIHRRISSMSEPGLNDQLRLLASPPSFVTSFPEHISGPVTPPGPSAEEFAKLRAELTACQQALQEATDAREASETAVRALKEFIAENAVGESTSISGSEGLQGLRLPPLPTDANVADAEPSAPKKTEEKRGWGNWLKRGDSSSSAPKPNPAPVSSSSSIKSIHEEEEIPPIPTITTSNTPLTNFVNSWTRSRSASSSVDGGPSPVAELAPGTPASQPSGFARFFGKATNTAPNTPAPAPAPTLAPEEPEISRSSTPSSHLKTRFEAEPESPPESPKNIPPPLQLRREGSQRDSVSTVTTDGPEPISPPADMVDIVLDHRLPGEKEEFAGERTPTVHSTTGFAM